MAHNMFDRAIYERLSILEGDNRRLQRDVVELERKVAYYDKMAAKWGGACIGALAIGAIIGGGFEKVRDKIIGWFL